ncbi:uncharacterized protein LOC109950598 [Prunus persica]|uniref:uncharacterized protein LOC109950598 n=1 Tax=Prunus persica TaxID=3760 RepID=UPI0009AB4E3D|nr:uncharacterized protein LOC109950598 [Prunus persica]
MASSSSVKIDGLLSMVTIRLSDNNFLKWSFQLESVLQGYELFGYFDGSIVQPPKYAILDEEGVTSQVTAGYKEWLKTDKALLSLLIATLTDEALEYVIGTKTAREAWLNLVDRYASVSRARINHLKTELQTAQKGGDSIERFLLRLKHIRDQLAQAGVKVSDDDFMIAALNGLPPEYDMIKTVLIARDSSISLKDFRAQLLAAEQTAEARILTHSAMLTSHHPATGYHSVVASPSGYAPPFLRIQVYCRFLLVQQLLVMHLMLIISFIAHVVYLGRVVL